MLLLQLGGDHFVIGFACELQEYLIYLPDSCLIVVVVHTFQKVGCDTLEKVEKPHCIHEQTVIQPIHFLSRQAQISQGNSVNPVST